MNKFVYFGAPWCGPCKAVKPWVKERVPADNLVEIDMEDRPDMVQQYGVSMVPTIVITDKDGLQIDRLNGEGLIRRYLVQKVESFANGG